MASSINTGTIVRVLGRLVVIEAILLLFPLAVCLMYGESEWKIFAIASLSAGVAGGIAEAFTARHPATVRSREGFVITSLIWIVFALFGVIPFMLCSHPLSFTDAVFEVISGLTTTGASMITDVEELSHGLLFWRAFTQWIGGLGIILFMLAVLPELNKAAGISMFQAEATGITHDKIHPRIRQTAIAVWGVYCVLTVSTIILLWAGPMNLFDSVCQTFATVATGGFTTRNQGIEYWHSDYVLIVITISMFLAGLNFSMMYNAWRNGIATALRNSIFRFFAMLVLAAFMLLMLSLALDGDAGGENGSPLKALFHVISAVTSTGFTIGAAEGWGQFALFLTIMLMLCGSCTGSTSGGIKVDRLMALNENLGNEVKRTVFPKRTYVVHLNGSSLSASQMSRITAFVFIYITVVAVSTGIIAMSGYSFVDSLFMTASCIGCNGLGYGATGAGGGFGLLPAGIKWLLTAVMLVGRLELFTFLVMLLPSFWRR